MGPLKVQETTTENEKVHFAVDFVEHLAFCY